MSLIDNIGNFDQSDLPEPEKFIVELTAYELPIYIFVLRNSINSHLLAASKQSDAKTSQIVKNVLSTLMSLHSRAWEIYNYLIENEEIDRDEHWEHEFMLTDHIWETFTNYLVNKKKWHINKQEDNCPLCEV